MEKTITKKRKDKLDLGEIENSLGFLVRLAQVKVFRNFYQVMEAQDIRPGEFTVLSVIGLNKDLRQGTIARKLNIKPAHMTKLTDRMVRAGYVERIVPPDDRRSVHLALTKSGEAFVAHNQKLFNELQQIERENLTDAELEQLTALLRKFIGMEKRS